MACNFETRPIASIPLLKSAALLAGAFVAGVVLLPATAHADVIARWDFADEDLVVDEANAANTTAVISATGSNSFVSCSSNCAASFSQLATADTSAVTINVDTSSHANIVVSFSTRTSGTASRYWRVEASDGGGFVALPPLIEEDANGGFLDHVYSLDAIAGDVTAVRLVATDSNGDGTGDFIQADGEGAPSTAGTLRLDDILIEGTLLLDDGGIPPEPEPVDAGEPEEDAGPLVDGGEPEPADAGEPEPVDAGAPDVPVLIVTELFFNALSGSDLGKEWVEIENVSDQVVPLDGVTIESNKNITPVTERTHTFEGTNISLNPGDRIVIAQSADLGAGVCVDGTVIVLSDATFSFSQSASTQRVRVFAPARGDVPAFDFALQYKGGDAPETAITNGASITFDGTDVGFEADCAYATGAFGSPGLPAGACAVDAYTCPDGGAPSPEGVPDAEPAVEPEPLLPNTAPEIALENVATNGTSVTLRWTASDAEDGAEVDVALFYDTDDEGFDGVVISRGLPGGSGQTFTWDLQGAPAGTYRIFGRVTDSRGDAAYAYAGGSVQVGGEQGGVATLVVIEPDGVNDEREDGTILISWEALLPIGTTGSVSLFYDTDDTGLDGTPIAAGLPPAGEGATLLWTPVDVPAGAYSIYAVLDWTGGQVGAYGSVVNIGATGCSCDQLGAPNGDTLGAASLSPFRGISPLDLLCALGIAILGFLVLRRPRRVRPNRSESFSWSA